MNARHGSLAAGFDVDCKNISNCCDAELTIGGNGTTQYYVCTGCGYPCDVKEKADDGTKTNLQALP